MKHIKKITAMLLATLLLVTVIPLAAVFAADINEDDLIFGDGAGITRAQWLHNLVVVFEMEANPDALPENQFTDLTEEHPYYEDIITAVYHGVVNVGAGYALQPDVPATRDFAASTLNFCLGFQLEAGTAYTFEDVEASVDPDSAQVALNRDWFAPVDGSFLPNAPITEDEVRTMVEDAAQILEKEIVDPDKEDSYTLLEGVKEIPAQDDFVLEEDGTLVVEDLSVNIAKDDKFVAVVHGIPRSFQAVSVTTTGTVTRIATQDLPVTEAFSALEVQGIADADQMDFEAIGDTKVELIQSADASTYTVKSLTTLSGSNSFDLGDGLSFTVAAEIKQPKVEYYLGLDRAYVKFMGDAELTFGVETSLSEALLGDDEFDLYKLVVPGVGGVVLSAEVDIKGAVNGVVQGYMTAGVEGRLFEGVRLIKSFRPSTGHIVAELSAKIGLKAKLGLTELKIVEGYVYAAAGIQGKASLNTYFDGKLPLTCTDFSAHLYVRVGAYGGIDLGIWKEEIDLGEDLIHAGNSPFRPHAHYEDGKKVAKCTREDSGTTSSVGTPGYFGTGSYVRPYTKNTSYQNSSGWSDGDNSYGLTESGEPICIYSYEMDGGKGIRITEYVGNGAVVDIPEQIDGYTVTSIGEYAFSGSGMHTITMPDTVTTIESRAFANCYNLKTVELSANLTTMYTRAFADCVKLRNITIPKSLLSCELYLSDADYGVFVGCASLATPVLEQGMTKIPNLLFAGCEGLRSITIPSSVTAIGNQAFESCTNLTQIDIPAGVKTIGGSAFYETGLESVTMADTVTYIGGSAFAENYNLKTVKMSMGLQEVGTAVFKNCRLLDGITLPKTLITCDNYLESYSRGMFYGCSSLKSITLEQGMTKIPAYVLLGCQSIESITIPSSVTAIGTKAFAGCSSLKRIDIPAGVKTIDSSAFYETGLENVTIADTVTYIGGSAFAENYSLKTVKMSMGLQEVGTAVFKNCRFLEAITLPKTLVTCDHYLEAPDRGMFYGCSNLKSVTLEQGMTAVPAYVLIGCTSLETITIPDTVTAIGTHAFSSCTLLKDVTLPAGLKTIGNSAFYNCDALTTVSMPKTMTSLGSSVFGDCDTLVTVTMEDAVVTLGSNVFEHCDMLKNVTLSRYIKTIPSGTFRNCAALEEITLPYYTSKIESNAFASCLSLVKVVMPRGLASVASNSFTANNVTQVYGVADTYAQTWAEGFGYTFVPHTVKFTEATLENGPLTLYKGESFLLRLQVTPADGNEEIVFKSANTAVVTVAADGTVKAVAPGSTTVKVNAGDISLSCKVTVYQPVTGITLNKTALTLDGLQTFQLTATVAPADANDPSVTWSSSDESVATVSSDGLVTAHKKGKAVITVAANDPSGITATCEVTVNNSGYLVTDPAQLESDHNYANSCTDFWIYTDAGKSGLVLTFDERTDIEEDFDFLNIYDGQGNLVGRYTGTQLAGQSVSVAGDTVKLQLDTDNSGNAWGFKVVSVTASQGVANGWVLDGDKWYFYENGAMVKNDWRKDTVGWVYLGADGAMLTSTWVQDSKGWCYVGADGYCETNTWKKDSVGWVYLDSEGSMVKNQWVQDGGKWYFLDSEGYMVSNEWRKDSVGWCWLTASGAMATNQWVRDSKGWCYVGADGYCWTNCWAKDSVGWVYLDKEGSMVYNQWIQDGGSWYYIGSDGYMVYGTSMKIDGKTYHFNASGVCTNP